MFLIATPTCLIYFVVFRFVNKSTSAALPQTQAQPVPRSSPMSRATDDSNTNSAIAAARSRAADNADSINGNGNGNGSSTLHVRTSPQLATRCVDATQIETGAGAGAGIVVTDSKPETQWKRTSRVVRSILSPATQLAAVYFFGNAIMYMLPFGNLQFWQSTWLRSVSLPRRIRTRLTTTGGPRMPTRFWHSAINLAS